MVIFVHMLIQNGEILCGHIPRQRNTENYCVAYLNTCTHYVSVGEKNRRVQISTYPRK